MRGRLSLILNAVVSVAVLTVVFVGARGSVAAAFELVNAAGALSLSNSHADAAIFDGAGLRPGQPVTGTVTIGNTGSSAAELTLRAVAEGDRPGAGGGSLWDELQIRIADATGVLYEGRVAGLGDRTLGTLGAGATDTYGFTAWLPGGDGDAFQGARLSLGFTWAATAHESSAPVETPVPVAPTPPPAPVQTATPATADPSAGVTANGLMSLPTSCVSRTALVLRLHPPKGVTVSSVNATVNGKKAHLKRTGGKVTLSLLPKGRLKVKVDAVLGTGRKLSLARAYKSCAAR